MMMRLNLSAGMKAKQDHFHLPNMTQLEKTAMRIYWDDIGRSDRGHPPACRAGAKGEVE